MRAEIYEQRSRSRSQVRRGEWAVYWRLWLEPFRVVRGNERGICPGHADAGGGSTRPISERCVIVRRAERTESLAAENEVTVRVDGGNEPSIG